MITLVDDNNKKYSKEISKEQLTCNFDYFTALFSMNPEINEIDMEKGFIETLVVLLKDKIQYYNLLNDNVQQVLETLGLLHSLFPKEDMLNKLSKWVKYMCLYYYSFEYPWNSCGNKRYIYFVIGILRDPKLLEYHNLMRSVKEHLHNMPKVNKYYIINSIVDDMNYTDILNNINANKKLIIENENKGWKTIRTGNWYNHSNRPVFDITIFLRTLGDASYEFTIIEEDNLIVGYENYPWVNSLTTKQYKRSMFSGNQVMNMDIDRNYYNPIGYYNIDRIFNGGELNDVWCVIGKIVSNITAHFIHTHLKLLEAMQKENQEFIITHITQPIIPIMNKYHTVFHKKIKKIINEQIAIYTLAHNELSNIWDDVVASYQEFIDTHYIEWEKRWRYEHHKYVCAYNYHYYNELAFKQFLSYGLEPLTTPYSISIKSQLDTTSYNKSIIFHSSHSFFEPIHYVCNDKNVSKNNKFIKKQEWKRRTKNNKYNKIVTKKKNYLVHKKTNKLKYKY